MSQSIRVEVSTRWVERCVDLIAATATYSIAKRGRFVMGVSGGSTPAPVFAELVRRQLPWAKMTFVQVDERVAAKGTPERNLTEQARTLGRTRARLLELPIDDSGENLADAEALDRFETELRASLSGGLFDLVHLGLGSDGHTASLVPGDPILQVRDRWLAYTEAYRGTRRLSLTSPALNATRKVLWIAVGAAKQPVIGRLMERDASLVASSVQSGRQVVVTDSARNFD